MERELTLQQNPYSISHQNFSTLPHHFWEVKSSVCIYMYTVSQKNCAKLFLSELHQISTNLDNFWQRDGKEAKIMQGHGALTFHLIYFVPAINL